MSDFEPMDLPKPKGSNRYLIIGLVTFLAIIALVTFIENVNLQARVKLLATPCYVAMEKASLEDDSTLAEPLLQDTVYACRSGSEWMSALREYPAAMAFNTVNGDELEIICYKYRAAPSCVNP